MSTQSNNTTNQKESNFIKHKANVLESKREQQIAQSNRDQEFQKAKDSNLPAGERLAAAGNVVMEAGKEAVEKVREVAESAFASNETSNTTKKLESLEREPDVRSTDTIHDQHCTAPRDVNYDKLGESKMIENRVQALESQRKADELATEQMVHENQKQNAPSTKDQVVEGYKGTVSTAHQMTHEATAAVHNRKANKDAEQVFTK